METSKVCNNVPYEDIKRFVQEDLSEYGQDNQCPISETVILGDGLFRHYELGSIIGYVCWNEFIEYDGEKHMSIMISEVKEDDEYWFAPRTPMYMAAAWMNDMKKTLSRMYKWYHEHFFEGFKMENGLLKNLSQL